MASTLFRATAHVGQYFKLSRGLKYMSLHHAAQLDELSDSHASMDLPWQSEDHDTAIPLETPKRRVFDLPKGLKPILLQRPDYIEKALVPLVDIIDQDPAASLYLSMDAEWNIRRRIGVSILQLCPHIAPTVVYIISVYRFSSLPPSLLRLLTSERVWKVGSHIKGDLTRLRKQFPSQLAYPTRFSTIDLKNYALTKGFIQPKQTGSLASLCETVLGMHLPKHQQSRANNSWEYPIIPTSLLHYAACDVLASRMIFEKISSEVEACFAPTKSEQDGNRGVQVKVLETQAGAKLYSHPRPVLESSCGGSIGP